MTKEEILKIAKEYDLIAGNADARLKKTWHKGCRDVAIEIRARKQARGQE
jgi:hypothetical protein